MFTTSIHTHVRSEYDADIPASKLCKKIKDLGGSGICITDHGILSAIEDYREVFTKEGLKLVPGCELYIEDSLGGRSHLIVLAKSFKGYRAISKMVTAANKNLKSGFPVLDKATLFAIASNSKFKGEVICTSACMNGVLASILLQNQKIDKKINTLKTKQGRYAAPESQVVKTARLSLENSKEELLRLTNERDELKRQSELKTGALEKKLAKATGEERSTLEAEITKIQATKKNAEDKLPAAKEAVELAKKKVSEYQKTAKGLDEYVAKFTDIETEITELTKLRKDDGELMTLATKAAKEYRDVFGDNFYIEVQNHGIPEELEYYPKAVKVARELNIPLVASNDVHILENTEDEKLKRQILRSLRFGENFEERGVGDDELYLKTDEELTEWLSKILPEDAVKEAVSNIAEVFNRCDVVFEKESHYPKFSKTEDANKLLLKAIRKGAAERFPAGMTQEYKDRINYEYNIIKKMGYSDYHLIVQDFLAYGKLLGYVPTDMIAEAPLTIAELETWIKEHGWKNPGLYTGPGRGSAAGSLICYCLGITNLDPIKNGLLFERFLNPERVSMPKQYWAIIVNPITQGCVAA